MSGTRNDRALRIIQEVGLARASDLEARGVPRATLHRLVRAGLVARQARGVYAIAGRAPTAGHTLAQVARRVPAGVFCLLTALRFHELTTQSPAEVWIALPEKARKPRLDYPKLRVARFSGQALSEGIETHRLEGVQVRVYSAAKTVADLLQVSQQGRDRRGCRGVARLQPPLSWRRDPALALFARICRVARVMQPYLDEIA